MFGEVISRVRGVLSEVRGVFTGGFGGVKGVVRRVFREVK